MNNEELKKKLAGEEKHDFASLRTLVEVLRGEGGCMWDREQTHKTIRNDIIEETYEVVEAIDSEDSKLLREELGDVLFQVLFHSRIEEEAGSFSIDEVINDIAEKMILRHPHVFGEVKVGSSSEILDNWDEIKKAEKKRETEKSTLESVPKQFPALMRTRKIIKKSRKFGYDFGSDEELCEKIKSLADSAFEAEGEQREKLVAEMIFASVAFLGDGADIEKAVSDKVDDFIKNYPTEE